MLDEEGHSGLVVYGFHVDLRSGQLALTNLLALLVVIVPVALFDMPHNSNESSFLFLNS